MFVSSTTRATGYHQRKMIPQFVGLWLLLQVTASSDVTLKYSHVISYLRQVSDPDVIPIPDNEDAPLKVTLQVSLVNIIDVDKGRNQVDVQIWLTESWQNKALAWDVKDNGFNLSYVSIPANSLWLPDITIINTITKLEVLSPEIAVVSNNGLVYWVPNLRTRVTCNLEDLDSRQGANCTIKFLSWTYSGNHLTISNESSSSLDEYNPNPRYEIINTSHIQETKYYTCCPEPYNSFSFSFVIRSANQEEARVIRQRAKLI